MPARLSHVVVLTDDYDAHSRFLVDVVGMTAGSDVDIAAAQLSEIFGWEGVDRTRCRMHGEGPGSVELVEIPEPLRGQVAPGVGFLTFLSRDSTAAAEKAAASGFRTQGPVAAPNPAGGELRCAFVTWPGTKVELVELVGR